MKSRSVRFAFACEVRLERTPPAVPVSVVYLSARGMTPRLRALIEALATSGGGKT